MPVPGGKDAAKHDAPPLCALPAAVDTAASMTADQTPRSAPPAVSAPRRVLVVDDHLRTLAAIAALLHEEYPRIEVVGTASDGDSALQKLAAAAPDVVVLDLDLGRERGIDLLPAIRCHPGVTVVILSASDDPRERAQALAAGARAFISKFSPAEELVAAILGAGSDGAG